MNKKRNIIIGSIICVLLMTVVFFVFNHGKSNEQVVTEYFELLKKKDYKQMYQMLDQKTVYTPTQKYFIVVNYFHDRYYFHNFVGFKILKPTFYDLLKK